MHVEHRVSNIAWDWKRLKELKGCCFVFKFWGGVDVLGLDFLLSCSINDMSCRVFVFLTGSIAVSTVPRTLFHSDVLSEHRPKLCLEYNHI